MKTEENKKSLLDYPEPSTDFNNKLTEKEIEKAPNLIKKERPSHTEWFRVYDPSGNGDLTKMPRRVVIELPVKGASQPFICFGPQNFYERIKSDFGKVLTVRLAYFETSTGRQGIWPVKEAIEYANGNVNAWNISANTILEQALTKWVRVLSNQTDGYYEGYLADQKKVDMYNEQKRPHFKLGYEEAIKKAYQGFILTPDNYDTDPHVQDFKGEKVVQEVKNEKGKRAN
jgi:hypothetical protein